MHAVHCTAYVATSRLKIKCVTENVTDGWNEGPRDQQTNGPTDRRTDTSSCRFASSQLIKKVALKVWRQITPQYLQTLYKAMPRRTAAVIEAY